ncbi:hypothetical protein B0H13DRAFT_1733200 [Mycena leptocephala]|nr:hypothetical protein B0H13DRAFT_1733200 [Mycena leptocephala]
MATPSINLMDFGHQTPFLPLGLFSSASQPAILISRHPTHETPRRSLGSRSQRSN